MTVPVASSDLYSSLGLTVPDAESDDKRISVALDLVAIQARCRLLALSVTYGIVTLTLIVGISVTASLLFALGARSLAPVALSLAGVGLVMQSWEISENYQALHESRLIESDLIEKLHELDSAERQLRKAFRYHRGVDLDVRAEATE